MKKKERVIIMGSAGRDFHNFNMYYRDNPNYEVVAFTAASQVPGIGGRVYPPSLAGSLYPEGIPIKSEEELPELIKKHKVDDVVFAYSDVSHEYVMHKASLVLSLGPSFRLMGGDATMLTSKLPVVSVNAVRTGSGKSPVSRRVIRVLKELGYTPVVMKHPNPYGDLEKQVIQRFKDTSDLDKHDCTIEEREEYEPHLDMGTVVFAGVDYEMILKEVEKEADIILWDGGNNDLPFLRPNVHIVVTDPLRAGHEVLYHPGESGLRRANVVVINKIDSANYSDIQSVRRNIQAVNPKAIIIETVSPISVEKPMDLSGKQVLVIEDGPTLTHGNMPYGAGVIAAQRYGATPVDPRPYAVGSIGETLKNFPQILNLIPAMGYGKNQLKELEETINKVPCDMVLIATPVEIRRLIKIRVPSQRVMYEVQEVGRPEFKEVLEAMIGLKVNSTLES